MKVNLRQELKEIGGKTLMTLSDEKIYRGLIDLINRAAQGKWDYSDLMQQVAKLEDTKKPVTLKEVCLNGLNFVEDRQRLGGYEKMKRFRLMMMIEASDEVDLSAEQIVLIKDSIGEAYPTPLVVGQAWMMLDPTDEAQEKKAPVECVPRRKGG